LFSEPQNLLANLAYTFILSAFCALYMQRIKDAYKFIYTEMKLKLEMKPIATQKTDRSI